MHKVPCPKCGEPNFTIDVLCWKCGAPMRKEAPAPPPTPQAEPEPMPVKEESPEQEMHPNAIMEAVIAMETEQVSYKKNLMLATIISGVIGIGVSLLFLIPFKLWISADSLPASVIIPFAIFSMLGGGAAGAISAFNKYGAVLGLSANAAVCILVRILAVSPSVVAPPGLWTFHLFSGYFVAFVGMLGSMLALRLLGRRVLLPAFSKENPINQNSALMIVLPVVMVGILGLSFMWYQNAIKQAANDPVRVIAGYCWVTSSKQDLPDGSADYLFSESMAVKGTAGVLKPAFLLPSPRIIKSMAYGNDTGYVKVLSGNDTAEVDLETSASGNTDVYGKLVDSDEPKYYVKFKLIRENGAWRISDKPAN